MTTQSAADEISDWFAQNLSKTVVELKKPGGIEVALEIYFNNSIEAEIAMRALPPFPVKGSAIREYADEEWTESWKKHFKPMEIGKRLRVVPPWLAGTGSREQGEGSREQGAGSRGQGAGSRGQKIEIVINPGLSFGTGNHFTTSFCLEQLDRFVPADRAETMLDIGTGSGILAIAAVKLGVDRAVGADFDPVCIECSIENAQANGVEGRISFFQHDITTGWPDETYDIVCANIYSSLLIDQAEVLLRIAKKHLLLTGIREMELDGVADTFVRLGGREVVRDSDCEWGGLVFERGTEQVSSCGLSAGF